MEIRPINLTIEQQRQLLPVQFHDLVNRDETHVFVALDGDMVQGTALASETIENGVSVLVIHYLSLVSAKNETVVMQLLAYLEQLCQKADIRKLVCRVTGQEQLLAAYNHILSNASFCRAFTKGRHMVYHLKAIKETIFFAKIPQLTPIMAKVKCYNELDMFHLSQFHDQLKATRILPEHYMPDLVFAQYYVDDDEIKGFMDFKEVDEGVLLLTDSYVEKDVKNQFVAPAMIACAMRTTDSFLTDEAQLILETYDEGMRSGITACFGQPEVDTAIWEYSKELG